MDILYSDLGLATFDTVKLFVSSHQATVRNCDLPVIDIKNKVFKDEETKSKVHQEPNIPTSLLRYLVFSSARPPVWSDILGLVQREALCGRYREVCSS
jgi:hypothetical protein